jgi:hypothetical protein
MSDIQQRNDEILAQIRIKRDELYSSILGLERDLSTPARGRVPEWAHGVSERLGLVGRAVDSHIAVTEGSGGLFADVMDRAPRLAHEIAALREEHRSLRSQLDEAARAVEAVEDLDGVEGARVRLLDLIRELLAHRHRGSELIYDAYNLDIGTGD